MVTIEKRPLLNGRFSFFYLESISRILCKMEVGSGMSEVRLIRVSSNFQFPTSNLHLTMVICLGLTLLYGSSGTSSTLLTKVGDTALHTSKDLAVSLSHYCEIHPRLMAGVP